ncbi:MAG TPA: potassium channel protein [Gemmataceae bacterium]|nr:potassium channel protein [Gemmataceae bacterium]
MPRRYFILILIPTVLMIGGTAGYYLLEDRYSLFDAFYMTVITLTTVGYEEVHPPLSPAGRVFTIVLLLVGVLTFFYTVTELVRVVISGEVQQLLGRRRMARSLAEMKNHMIICGYGRMGRRVCREFSQRGLPFVIIDRRTEVLRDFDLPHGIALEGDATSDEMLKRAGVERARALVTVAASDADNLFITLSARLLNDKLYIVARAEGELAEQKLRRAGASRVVTPYAIGGAKVAMAVLRPAVVDFIELATGTEHLDLQIEETLIQPGSKLSGVTLYASHLRQELGVIVVAIKKANGHLVANPPGDHIMTPGDTLIALGPRQGLDRVEILANHG